MRKNILLSLLALLPVAAYSQELYPMSEPASTIPHKVWGLRFHSETYKEVVQVRNVFYLRLMYGVTPKLTGYLSFFASNHHGKKLPSEFPYHNSPERGAIYPYKFDGANLYFKYRFFTWDQPKEHLRLAAYLEGAWVSTTHHEAEPNVSKGDNSGFSGGLIATYLKNKFAVSLTAGYTYPLGIFGYSPEEISGLPDIPQYVKFGPSIDYKLSLGYLVYPRKYKSFDQTNFNVYLEFIGKKYDATIVNIFYGRPNAYWLQNNLYPVGLQKGAYLEVNPGVQAILKSNTRIDFAMTFPMLGISYTKLYPVYTVGVQHYFFRK